MPSDLSFPMPPRYPRFSKERKDFYLNVLYEDRMIAKRMGAKWDPKEKKWFCMGTDDPLTKLSLLLKFTGNVFRDEPDLIW